jgi:hypothetical protein
MPLVGGPRKLLDTLRGLTRVGGKVMRRPMAAVVGTAFLAGCATSTGILPAGPNTYTISEKFAPIRDGSDEAERSVLTKANEFCAQQGRQFVPNNMGQAGSLLNPHGPTGYSVTFRCLSADDPAVANYHLQQAPNVIVEQRNR